MVPAGTFLAALSYIKEQTDDEKEQKAFLQKLYSQVSVMDSGARGSTTTFVENQKGDVLIAWENEAITTMKSYPDEYEMITPSVSILAQPSVAIVDDNADANGTQEVSREYLNYLYTDDAQRLAAEYGYRPSNESILKEFSDRFDLNVKLYTIKITAAGTKHIRTILTMEQCLMKSTAMNKTKKSTCDTGVSPHIGNYSDNAFPDCADPAGICDGFRIKTASGRVLVPDHEADRAACICDQHRMFVYCGTYKQCVRCDHCLGACKV